MKRSIQTKIILLIAMSILISATLIGGVGIARFKQAMDEDSVEILNLNCSNTAQELNRTFQRIEQSVETLAEYALQNMESLERLSSDGTYRTDYVQELKSLALMLADETDGAVSVYIRFNPELAGPLEGVFWVKEFGQQEFRDFPLTDLSAYDPDDMQNVGWYYVPVRAGHAIWVGPYLNAEMNQHVTSYVVPVYRDDVLVGVVGMDVDFRYVKTAVDHISVYDTGHAFLMNEEYHIVYSKHLTDGDIVDFKNELLETSEEDALFEHIVEGQRRKVVFRALENGMHLAVTVPVHEIMKDTNHLISQVAGIAVMIALVFIAIAASLARKMIHPLKELNAAAKEIAAGNLDISVPCDTKDEVSDLAESLGETARQLKIRIDYINSLAFKDKLTGVQNNTAYLQELALLREKMQSETVDFAVFIIDVNGLKQVNDTLGHAAGNELIIKTADSAVEVFGREKVFRIGGDEFAVIYPRADAALCDELKQNFEEAVARNGKEIHLSAAVGSALFDPALDDRYETVFERADSEMYRRKQELKGGAACR